MKGNFQRNLIVGFGLSLFVLLISSFASFLSIQNLIRSNNNIQNTQGMIFSLNDCFTHLLEAQTKMRGFLLTGKQEAFTGFEEAIENMEEELARVKTMTHDNLQTDHLLRLERTTQQFVEFMKSKVKEKHEGRAMEEGDLDEGIVMMSNIKSLISRIELQEQESLNNNIREAENYGMYSSILIVIAAIVALFTSIVFFFRIINDFKERSELYQRLQEKDAQMAARISAVSSIAGQIAKGDYSIRLEEQEADVLGSMAGYLNNMAQSLEKSFGILTEKEWLQKGVADLNNVMIGDKSLEKLAKDIVDMICQYTGSDAGAFYLIYGQELNFIAGNNFLPDRSQLSIPMGKGLSGKAASSKKIQFIEGANEENIRISYALGEMRPSNIIAIPLIDGELVGVIELASIQPYTNKEKDLLSILGHNIAIAIKSSQNRKWIQELLEETQGQTEELMAQQTEMESINAELVTQTEKLQASEEELRVQQEELQQINEELAERSVLLEERNLEIQKKSEDLEISTRYKSEFLANMSHELRTPLNSILLLSRLLSENNNGNMTKEQIEFAKVIQSSGNGLLSLIDEILDLSKIEAGKMDLDFMEVSVKEVTEDLKILFSEVAKQKNINFKITTDQAPLIFRSDKFRLEQILKNLISNAIKFTPEGEVELKIEMKNDEEKKIIFTVRDSGIGIPGEKQHLIFDAFQQADGSTKRKFGGTGLGLSISKELAKLLGGEILLTSEVDKGSEFSLILPLYGAAKPAKQLPKIIDHVPLNTEKEIAERKKAVIERIYISQEIPEAIPDDRNEIQKGDKIILIVEDDVNFAKSLLRFAQQREYKGIVCVRGDEAVSLALTYKPIGILLDIQLPVKSGWEVMDDRKKNNNTRHIPVHIMSSYKLRQESLLKGAVNFMDKPVAYEQFSEVFQKIEQIINRGESQKVLIIEDNAKHAQALSYFLQSNSIYAEIKNDINEGLDSLQKPDLDCVILDMGVPDHQAYEILENLKKNPQKQNLPVIVFTGKSLSMKEELKIKKYADSIVIKTAHSYRRMLDEVSLFLHLVEEKKKEGGKNHLKNLNMLQNVLEKKNVLLVDDDVRNIFSLTKALEASKVNVITAIDGEEALAVLEDNPKIDIVLLDMMMPNMDGYETATRIRQKKKYKNLPIIAVTSKAMTGDREKCINAGASDYITKPVDIDQLLSLLRVWLYYNK
jgi:signal transduction histidine kinase/DNA-binding response OmpR family regulator/CHASE3 domain sensor protein